MEMRHSVGFFFVVIMVSVKGQLKLNLNYESDFKTIVDEFKP